MYIYRLFDGTSQETCPFSTAFPRVIPASFLKHTALFCRRDLKRDVSTPDGFRVSHSRIFSDVYGSFVQKRPQFKCVDSWRHSHRSFPHHSHFFRGLFCQKLPLFRGFFCKGEDVSTLMRWLRWVGSLKS